jgi:hypothetical protein
MGAVYAAEDAKLHRAAVLNFFPVALSREAGIPGAAAAGGLVVNSRVA